MRKLPDNAGGKRSVAANIRPEKAIAHESAVKHVCGKARYLDDLPEPPGMLHVATGQSRYAHARVVTLDLTKVRNAAGVVDVIAQADTPGNPDISPVFSGDLVFAGDEVNYVGQPLFAVAASSLACAKRAAALAEVEYEVLPALLDAREALAREEFVLPSHRIVRGDAAGAIRRAPRRRSGNCTIRGQEHFYLEGQISIATPSEDGGIFVLSSTQHPSEVQKLVASVLALPINYVQVEVRRMGGGFGGKETQAAALACIAALFAQRTQQAVKYRMPRQDDMVQTGKRHDFYNHYEVGFDEEGKILGAKISLAGMCGYSADLSGAIVDRAMFHADNAYFLAHADIIGYRCRTDTVSNTAFRGFGGPQGMLSTESMMEDIARDLNKDPLDIRLKNLYQDDNNQTPYGQTVVGNVLPELLRQLEKSADYRRRRHNIRASNRQNPWLKKGLALTPVKFGISFTTAHLNQAGALVHIYTDGSIHLNHGGTEMGQGLYTKVAQIVARGLGVNVDRIMVSATRTDKVPNTSPTAASAGTDLNGMAALDAVAKIKAALFDFAAQHYAVAREKISLHHDQLWLHDKAMAFEEFIRTAYLHRIPLFASGFYRTPKIGYDREQGRGRPFYYFANGAAVAEVVVDVLTGEYKVERVDILHDVGDSINPALDIGQIEGGFVQGMGWLTSEELLWDQDGHILSNSPANYKIPTAGDLPEIFNIALFERPNHEATVYHSKAVGEPPLMLAIAVWCALKDACASLADYQFSPPLAAPATPEQVYKCLQAAISYQARRGDHAV